MNQGDILKLESYSSFEQDDVTVKNHPEVSHQHAYGFFFEFTLGMLLVPIIGALIFGIHWSFFKTKGAFLRRKYKVASEVESVNYFPTRQCNYSCKFCFHTAKNSFVLDEESAKKGLSLLAAEGMKKLNFSGGEPFTQAELLGKLSIFAKETLKLESVTLVTNGSLVKREWFEKYGKYIDIIAVSCDSFVEDTLKQIGRGISSSDHLKKLRCIRDWCKEFKVLFKINTVVTAAQYNEDMNAFIKELKPYRWKVFQCLLIDGENQGQNALRDAKALVVTSEQFNYFIKKHKENNPIPENNADMRNSYILLDERMRFLDCTTGAKIPSNSILDVGVKSALNHAGFDQKSFILRGGKFLWSKDDTKFDW